MLVASEVTETEQLAQPASRGTVTFSKCSSNLLVSLLAGVVEICLEIRCQTICENKVLGGEDVVVLLRVNAKVMTFSSGKLGHSNTGDPQSEIRWAAVLKPEGRLCIKLDPEQGGARGSDCIKFGLLIGEAPGTF